MLFTLLYDLGLFLLALMALPKFFFKRKKYRGLFNLRLGFTFPKIEKGRRKLIWIHAVSLGETKAILPLIEKFKALSHPPLILLSTLTKTGHQEGLKSQADWKVFLPFDFRFLIRPIVKRVKPDLVILTETDFWYHFQKEAKKSGAKLVVVNAKLSQRSFQRYRSLPFVKRKLLFPIDHFYVQGIHYENRFKKLGISSDKITVTGNIKLDHFPTVSTFPTRCQLGLSNQFVITIGSTHAPEEHIWIQALKQLWRRHSHLKAILVPRHPERFDEVAALLKREAVPFSRWSDSTHSGNVLLVDAMGVLLTCYQHCDLAFVGGSFTPKVGGHNLIEPLLFGKPVIFGPYMHSQPDLLDIVRSHHAGLQIEPEDIIPTVNQFIVNPSLSQKLGGNGEKLLLESKGALDFTFKLLQPLLEKNDS